MTDGITGSSAPQAPLPRDEAARARMQRQGRRDTRPEVALRRLLHARGLRYRVDAPLPIPGLRRRADLRFGPAKVAVFVDGCYWHACPVHATTPKTNTEFWASKLAANVRRDRDTDRRLSSMGWVVVRVWEHEDTSEAADRVQAALVASAARRRLSAT